MRMKNLMRGGGDREVRFKKTRLIHLGNVEKPPGYGYVAVGGSANWGKCQLGEIPIREMPVGGIKNII